MGAIKPDFTEFRNAVKELIEKDFITADIKIRVGYFDCIDYRDFKEGWTTISDARPAQKIVIEIIKEISEENK